MSKSEVYIYTFANSAHTYFRFKSKPMHQLQGKKQFHYLVFYSEQEKLIVLKNWTYSIGRDVSNDILLESHSISRVHATLVRSNYRGRCQYTLVDGSVDGKTSFNGIYVNGKRVQEQILTHNDKISFGGVVEAVFHSSNQVISDHLNRNLNGSPGIKPTKTNNYSENEATSIML